MNPAIQYYIIYGPLLNQTSTEACNSVACFWIALFMLGFGVFSIVLVIVFAIIMWRNL